MMQTSARRGVTLFEMVVVLALFSILTVFIMGAAMPIQSNGRYIEDFVLRQAVAQDVAQQIARELSNALRPEGSHAFVHRAGKEQDGGLSDLECVVPSGLVGEGTWTVRYRTVREKRGDKEQVVIVREQSGGAGDPVERFVYGHAESEAWAYALHCEMISPGGQPDPVTREWRAGRLPEGVRVRVTIRRTIPRFEKAAPAVGIAVGRMRNAGGAT